MTTQCDRLAALLATTTWRMDYPDGRTTTLVLNDGALRDMADALIARGVRVHSDTDPVDLDDYMAGHRKGVSDERARLREAVSDVPTFHTHGLPVSPIRMSLDEFRTAILALLEADR